MQKYYFPATMELRKSDGDSDDERRIPIRIVASEDTVDKVNDIIVSKAFENARDSYLREGYIDYDHVSIRGKTPLEREEARIGEPTDLKVEKGVGGTSLPVCEGFLFKGNPYVDRCIYPALLAKSKIYGASVGGNILKKSDEWDTDRKAKVRKITDINLIHIAVTPMHKAIHPNTSVALMKALAEEDGIIEFASLGELAKALTAGVSTDIANIRGGQALQAQSLEGEPVEAIWSKLLHGLAKGQVEPSFDGLTSWLVSNGLSLQKSRAVAIVAARNVDRLSNALKSII